MGGIYSVYYTEFYMQRVTLVRGLCHLGPAAGLGVPRAGVAAAAAVPEATLSMKEQPRRKSKQAV